MHAYTAVIPLVWFALHSEAVKLTPSSAPFPPHPLQEPRFSMSRDPIEQLTTDSVLAATDAPEGFPAKRTAEIVGITYRQLDYWARTNLVKPTSPAVGSGSRRTYSYKNLLELRAVKNLLDAGIKLELVRNVFDYLRDQLDQDPTEVNLVISGDSVLIRSGEQIIDLLRDGQGVLNVLPLAGVQSEVDARIVELYPELDIETVKAPIAATN